MRLVHAAQIMHKEMFENKFSLVDPLKSHVNKTLHHHH